MQYTTNIFLAILMKNLGVNDFKFTIEFYKAKITDFRNFLQSKNNSF